MSDLSDSSLREEDNDDIIAEYENKDLDRENISDVDNDLDRENTSDVDNDPDRENISDDDNDQSQEAQQTAPRRIDPKTSKKRITLNPIPKLNTERLKGPKGIQTIEKYFEGFKFHGKGHESADLDRVMKRLEHWSHRLFPKLYFDDFLERVEVLGFKRDLQTFKKKYTMGEITVDEHVSVPQDILDEESDKEESTPLDEFDVLIAEQIQKQTRALQNNSAFDNLLNASNTNAQNKTPTDQTLVTSTQRNSDKLDNSTSTFELTDEVKERIERNRQQAVQRRLARVQAIQELAERKKLEESGNINVANIPSEDLSTAIDKSSHGEDTAETNTTNITNMELSLL